MLSAKLADNKYFCGDKPSSLDALIFGYLAPLLHLSLPNDRLQMHLCSYPNLVRFVESILSIYLPPSEEMQQEQSANRRLWARRKADAQRTMEEARIQREERKSEQVLCLLPLVRTGSVDNQISITILFLIFVFPGTRQRHADARDGVVCSGGTFALDGVRYPYRNNPN